MPYYGFDVARFGISVFDDRKILYTVGNESVTLADALNKKVSISKSDTLSLTDAITKLAKKVLSETIALDDDLIPKAFIQFVESITLTDSIHSLVQAVRSDTLTLSDLLNKRPNISVQDLIALESITTQAAVTDIVSKSIQPSIADTVALSDALRKAITTYKSDSLTLADLISAETGKDIDDVLSVLDDIAKLIKDNSNDEAIAVADNLLRKYSPDSSDETTSLSDYISKETDLNKSEGITTADSLVNEVGKLISDLLSVADTIKALAQDVNADATAATDSLGIYVKRTVNDVITLADNISMYPKLLRPMYATFGSTFFDNTSFDDVTGDPVGVTDSIDFDMCLGAVLADTLNVVDAITKTIKPVIADALGLSDSHIKAAKTVSNDNLVLSDSIISNVSKVLSDLAALSDSYGNSVYTQAIDLLSIDDGLATDVTIMLSDVITFADNVINTAKLLKSDTAALADAAVSNFNKYLNETIALSENIAKYITDGVTDDTTSSSDSIALKVSKLLSDTVAIIDDASQYNELIINNKALFDTAFFDSTRFDDLVGKDLDITDAIQIAMMYGIIQSDVVNLVDIIQARISTVNSDISTVNDSNVLNVQKLQAESVATSDNHSKNILSNIYELLTLSEEVAKKVLTSALDSTGVDDSYKLAIMPLVLDLVNSMDNLTEVEVTKRLDEILNLTEIARVEDDLGSSNEASTVIDNIVTALTVIRSYSDTLTCLDSLRACLGKICNEIISLSDSYNFSINSAKAEVLSLIETLGIDVDKPLPLDLVGVIDEAAIQNALGLRQDDAGVYDSIEGRKFIMLQQVFIQGVQVPVTGLKIQHSVKDRVSTCTFSIPSPSIEVINLAKQRTEVRAYLVDGEGCTDYFGGRVVNNPVSARTSISSQLEITVDDWTAAANDILVTEHYSSTDGTLTDIVKKMWQKYYPYEINLDYINISIKQLDNISFNYDNLFDATEQIAQLLGWVWYVDWNGSERVLQFFPPSVAVKPVTLSVENRNVAAGTAKFGQDTKLVNSVYVFGGDGLSNPTTENFLADGQRLAYSIGSKPDKVAVEYGITVTVNGIEQILGFANADDPANFDALVDYDNKVVIWREDNKPSKDAVISMTYQFTYPILVHLTDDASIKQFGLCEDRIQDSKIKTVQIAREVGRAYLRENAYPKGYGSCEVYVEGLRAGDFITVDLPKYNVYGLYEILEIEKWIEVGKVRRRVTLNVSDDAGSRIAQRLKEFSKRLASLEANQRPEDLVVQRILRNTRNLGLTLSANVKGNIYSSCTDNLSFVEVFVAMLRSDTSIKGVSMEYIPADDSVSKKASTISGDNLVVHEYVKFGTAFLDKAKLDTAVFGGEVIS